MLRLTIFGLELTFQIVRRSRFFGKARQKKLHNISRHPAILKWTQQLLVKQSWNLESTSHLTVSTKDFFSTCPLNYSHVLDLTSYRPSINLNFSIQVS